MSVFHKMLLVPLFFNIGMAGYSDPPQPYHSGLHATPDYPAVDP